MADFGVTQDGFRIKGLDVILAETLDRARQVFRDLGDLDLGPTSPLLKLLQPTAYETAELWKRMEDLFYANFASTAVGPALDLLGEDLGLPRRRLFSTGVVTVNVVNPAPGRAYVIPEGTVLITAAPVQVFVTGVALTLTAEAASADVVANALARGPDSDVAAGAITGVDPAFQTVALSLGGATLKVTNAQPFSGGAATETDDDYRPRLLGLPRNLWTVESVRAAALEVDGVIDVLVSDPLGGVDVSQSYFNGFLFNDRLFSGERSPGSPYFFDVVVAHEFSRPWLASKVNGVDVPGVFDQVRDAVDRVRPVGIHPKIVEANHIEVGIRARVIVQPGQDRTALLSSIKRRLASDLGRLKLGNDVLFSQAMRSITEQPGVIDVQDMHLRRLPAAFGRISFGSVPFQAGAAEAGPGENLSMGPTEIAFFRIDSDLIDLEVSPR
jgi:phage-related baseplate assembly protein